MKKFSAKSIMIKVIIAIILIIDVYPIFWLLCASIKENYEWTEFPAYALPRSFHWQNYVEAWTRGHMAIFFRNSLTGRLTADALNSQSG